MSAGEIRHVVIAGGGTAGWMTACALSYLLPKTVRITLIESDEIGTVGVGEATIPPIVTFNQMLGIDEDAFLKATHGTFKLGIEFAGWGKADGRYMHPFGAYGVDMKGIRFHQFYLALKQAGVADIGRLEDYCLSATAAYQGRFVRPPSDAGEVLSTLKYAFHFDAGLYARFLRQRSEAQGVTRLEGRIGEVTLNSGSGHIESLTLEGERVVAGDLFIDCTGFRGLLIEGALKTGYQDWRSWLPCDRAWAVPCASVGPPTPYTRSTADAAGWRWRIPLQHRTGNGYVFASDFISEAAARERLLASLDGPALAEPRLLKFVTGRRNLFWNKNCVAIGLSGGFLEPLESTSIHLIQAAIAKLVALFPDQGFNPAERDEYNQTTITQFEQVRDFIIAHYKVTEREDTPFWAHCRAMTPPDSLAHKLALYRHRGRLIRHDDDLFAENSWLAILDGQGIAPEGHDILVDALPQADIIDNLRHIRGAVLATAKALPTHQGFLDRFCRSEAAALPLKIPV